MQLLSYFMIVGFIQESVHTIQLIIVLNGMKAYRTKDTSAYVEEYRKRCLVLGREILVLGKGEARKAMALDVDEDCRLVVRYGDGRMERLSSGEIRIQM